MEVQDKRLFITLSKNKPCYDCGCKFHYSMMQFDHVPGRGEKKFNISADSENGFYGKSLEEIKEEIKKCDLVCANCHHLRTFKRSEKYGNYFNGGIPDEELFNFSDTQLIEMYRTVKNLQIKKSRDKKKIITMGLKEIEL